MLGIRDPTGLLLVIGHALLCRRYAPGAFDIDVLRNDPRRIWPDRAMHLAGRRHVTDPYRRLSALEVTAA